MHAKAWDRRLISLCKNSCTPWMNRMCSAGFSATDESWGFFFCVLNFFTMKLHLWGRLSPSLCPSSDLIQSHMVAWGYKWIPGLDKSTVYSVYTEGQQLSRISGWRFSQALLCEQHFELGMLEIGLETFRIQDVWPSSSPSSGSSGQAFEGSSIHIFTLSLHSIPLNFRL